jgi:hypothetical protein
MPTTKIPDMKVFFKKFIVSNKTLEEDKNQNLYRNNKLTLKPETIIPNDVIDEIFINSSLAAY